MSAAEGQPAPALDLPTDGGGRVTLAALKGKPAVVLQQSVCLTCARAARRCTRKSLRLRRRLRLLWLKKPPAWLPK